MGALGPVDEIEIEHHRLAVPGQAGRHPALDGGEVESFVTLGVDGPPHLGARQRRDERLRHDAGDLHLRRLDDLGREDPVGDQEHVGVEPGALVPGPHLADDPVDRHPLAVGQGAVDGDHVVELQVLAGRDGDPELEGRRLVGPEHPSHRHAPILARTRVSERPGGRRGLGSRWG